MSHFYGEIEGKAQTPATRTGTKNSGMFAHIRGWGIGVVVNCNYDEEKEEDVISVSVSGGSNGRNGNVSVFEVSESGKITFSDNRLNLVDKANKKIQ